jgi:hypothetical protein
MEIAIKKARFVSDSIESCFSGMKGVLFSPTNIEGEAINRIYQAVDEGFDGLVHPSTIVWINRQCARVRFSWLFIRTQVFDPQSSLRNVHVEAMGIFLNCTL